MKGEQRLKVEFVYDSVIVEDVPEEDFIAKKKAELNSREPGRGNEWERKWRGDRKARFEPMFMELLGKYSKLSTDGPGSAKYTLIFKTTRTDPGKWSTGNKALLSANAWIIDTENPHIIIARFVLAEVPGRASMSFNPAKIGDGYDTGVRMEESYAKAGKMIGEIIAQRLR